MTTRTTSKIVTFARPFTLRGVDRVLPAGSYRVVTDEERIEESSFPVYRRVSTMIFVPAESCHASSIEMVTVDPRDLQEAQDHGAGTPASTDRKDAIAAGDDPREGTDIMSINDTLINGTRIDQQRSRTRR